MNKVIFYFITIILLLSPFQGNATTTSSGINNTLDKTLGAVSDGTRKITGSNILDSITPSRKKCNFVDNKKYQPFSDIGTDFPGLKVDDKGCIDVANGGTENLLSLLFTTAISIIIVLTVINLTVAGIQYMTEQATGQIKGGARKRLKDSIIALALGLLSYTILYTVNKQLVNFTFDPVSIDINNSVASGVNSANNAQIGGYSSGLGGIEFVGPPSPYNPFTAPSPTGWVYVQTGLPCTPLTPLSLIAPNVTQTTDASGRACRWRVSFGYV
jgi:hypothetical protein